MSEERQLLSLFAAQTKGLESPLEAGRRVIAERAALLSVMQGLSLTSLEILARCGVDVGEDALSEPNAGDEDYALSPESVEAIKTLLDAPANAEAGILELSEDEIL